LYALQVVQVVEVDEDVRGRGPSLHHVDERLPARERACALVLAEQAHGVLDARRASVLDLPQEHALFTAETPAPVKKEPPSHRLLRAVNGAMGRRPMGLSRRLWFALSVGLVAFIVGAAGAGAAPNTSPGAAQSVRPTCGTGTKRAVIGGKVRCLRSGQA